jgi:hypothetical protein
MKQALLFPDSLPFLFYGFRVIAPDIVLIHAATVPIALVREEAPRALLVEGALSPNNCQPAISLLRLSGHSP